MAHCCRRAAGAAIAALVAEDVNGACLMGSKGSPTHMYIICNATGAVGALAPLIHNDPYYHSRAKEHELQHKRAAHKRYIIKGP